MTQPNPDQESDQTRAVGSCELESSPNSSTARGRVGRIAMATYAPAARATNTKRSSDVSAGSSLVSKARSRHGQELAGAADRQDVEPNRVCDVLVGEHRQGDAERGRGGGKADQQRTETGEHEPARDRARCGARHEPADAARLRRSPLDLGELDLVPAMKEAQTERSKRLSPSASRWRWPTRAGRSGSPPAGWGRRSAPCDRSPPRTAVRRSQPPRSAATVECLGIHGSTSWVLRRIRDTIRFLRPHRPCQQFAPQKVAKWHVSVRSQPFGPSRDGRDAAQCATGAPRTMRPGRAPESLPSRCTTSPFTIVAT